MAMDKRIYYDGPLGEPTEKDLKEMETLFADDNDDEDIIEDLKKDPHALDGWGCDYTGDTPFDEFYKEIMAGKYNKK